MQRHSETLNAFVDKLGEDGGHDYHVRIEKDGDMPPRVVIHYGPMLVHNSALVDVLPSINEGMNQVCFFGADFAHWQNEGIFKMFSITFKNLEDAKQFVSTYDDLKPRRNIKKAPADNDIFNLEPMHNAVVALEEVEDEHGKCHECWNQGIVGDACDNCGEIMKKKKHDDSSEEDEKITSSKSSHNNSVSTDNKEDCAAHQNDDDNESEEEEELWAFGCTQDDWPVEPMRPYQNH